MNNTSNFKICVDADACPVKHIVVELGKKHDIPVFLYTDTSHIINDDYSTVIMVDKAPDSVDFAILNNLEENDIVVTQDYGLASLVLSKKAFAINQNGLFYTHANIDRLLEQRHINKVIRRGGGRITNVSKRNKDDDKKFYEAFSETIKKAVSNSELRKIEKF